MAPHAPDRLDGWAIADYLARDIRTLQRWRDERGLPIHRVPGRKGGIVFAYPAELDAWLRESPTVKKGESAAVVAESVDSPRSLRTGPFDSPALAPFDSRWSVSLTPFDWLALAQGKLGKQDPARERGVRGTGCMRFHPPPLAECLARTSSSCDRRPRRAADAPGPSIASQ